MAGRFTDIGQRDQNDYSEQQKKGDQVRNGKGPAVDVCLPRELGHGVGNRVECDQETRRRELG